MNLGFTVYGRLQTVLKFPTGRPSPFLTFLPLRGNERAVHPPQSQFLRATSPPLADLVYPVIRWCGVAWFPGLYIIYIYIYTHTHTHIYACARQGISRPRDEMVFQTPRSRSDSGTHAFSHTLNCLCDRAAASAAPSGLSRPDVAVFDDHCRRRTRILPLRHVVEQRHPIVHILQHEV
jgi:hypothetical protein